MISPGRVLCVFWDFGFFKVMSPGPDLGLGSVGLSWPVSCGFFKVMAPDQGLGSVGLSWAPGGLVLSFPDRGLVQIWGMVNLFCKRGIFWLGVWYYGIGFWGLRVKMLKKVIFHV